MRGGRGATLGEDGGSTRLVKVALWVKQDLLQVNRG
jgi:hypothetical protein